MTQIRISQFEGPFDLLLSLIDDEKLNVSEIALSDVTEQYLVYLDSIEKNRAEELADFLVVATRLLLLKSKRLLPQFMPEEDDGPSLEEQLRLYKRFVIAAKELDKRWQSGNRSVFRVEPPRRPAMFALPDNLSLDGLHAAMVQLVERLKPPKPLPHTVIDKAVSMKEKIDVIRKLLKDHKSILFFDLLDNSRNRTEIIVSFIALLELVKQKTVLLRQEGVFHDILIERV